MGWIPCSGNKAKTKKKKKTEQQEKPVDQIKLTPGTRVYVIIFVFV